SDVTILKSRLEKIDVTGKLPALFMESLEISGSRIEGSVNMAKSVFRRRVSISSTEFVGPFNAAGRHFDRGFQIADTDFADKADFRDIQTGNSAFSQTPEEPLEERLTSVERATFQRDATFFNARFSEGVALRRLTFRGTADFRSGFFVRDVEFGQVTFNEAA